MAADVLVHPDERRVSFRGAGLQRLEDEGRHVEIAGAAAVGDLLDLHEAGARGAPRLVGLGLLLEHPIEIRLARRTRFLPANAD